MSAITQMIRKLDLPDEICELIDSYNEFIFENEITKRFTHTRVAYDYVSPHWYSENSKSRHNVCGYLYTSGNYRITRQDDQYSLKHISHIADYSFNTYIQEKIYFMDTFVIKDIPIIDSKWKSNMTSLMKGDDWYNKR